jgi:hypothetical protein
MRQVMMRMKSVVAEAQRSTSKYSNNTLSTTEMIATLRQIDSGSPCSSGSGSASPSAALPDVTGGSSY